MIQLGSLRNSDPSGIHQEFRDLGRGIAWGLIFGMPVLYTMEVWLGGREVSPPLLALLLGGVLVLNVFVAYFAGLREHHRLRNLNLAFEDSITSMGIALILSTVILWAIGQVTPTLGLETQTSKIVLEACLMSVGITFTNLKFRNVATKSLEVNRDTHFNHLMAASGGAFIYSFNVAPTEEILLIASMLQNGQNMILFILELIFCYIVLHASGLKHRNLSLETVIEVFRTWSVAFLISILLLLCLGYGGLNPSDSLFYQTALVLAFPAVVGAAAGRLAV